MTHRRLRPFPGLPLGAEDLLADQAYHRGALRAHVLHHHGWGIWEGLRCEALPQEGAIAVSRGLAVTRRGDEVALGEGGVVPVRSPGAAPGEEVRVVLRAIETTDPTSAVPPFGGGEPEPSRVDEGAALALAPAGDPLGDDEVELCRFRVDARGRLAGGDVDRSRASRWQAPSRPEDAPLRAAAHALAEALAGLPGVLPPAGRQGAWLAMGAASTQVALLAGAADGQAAAALAARLVAQTEAWLLGEAPPDVASALAGPVGTALREWAERDGEGGDRREGWARQWVPALTRAAVQVAAGAASAAARPAFREVARSPVAGAAVPPGDARR